MRIRHKVTVHISDDASGKENLFGPFDDSVVEVVIDNYERQASGKLKILAGTTESVSFGDVDQVRGIFLKVDQDVVVRLNGGGERLGQKSYQKDPKFDGIQPINQVSRAPQAPQDDDFDPIRPF